MTETRFLLSGINNPNAPLRANGVRWWGHPSRHHRPRVIVLHTAESTPTGSSARAVAEWQSRAPVPSSYHVLCDSRTTLRTVRDDHTAFHAASFNSISLGISWATRASLWGTHPDWDTAALLRAAAVCRQWQALYAIPARWLSRPQVQAGASGFVRHSTLDPARRSDPGVKFPATRFFSLLDDEGDDMNAAQERKLDGLIQTVERALDRDRRPSLWRDVDQIKQAVGRLDGAIPNLAADVAAEVAAQLPAGTVDVDVLAGKVADVIFARVGDA